MPHSRKRFGEITSEPKRLTGKWRTAAELLDSSSYQMLSGAISSQNDIFQLEIRNIP